jgi:hypothetical protein
MATRYYNTTNHLIVKKDQKWIVAKKGFDLFYDENRSTGVTRGRGVGRQAGLLRCLELGKLAIALDNFGGAETRG